MDIKINASRTTTKNPKQDDFKLHTHNDYEIFCFLSGHADYSVEGNRYKLLPGDIIIMRKNEFHHLILKSDAPYGRVVVNFDIPSNPLNNELLSAFNKRNAGEKNLYRPSSLGENHLIYYLQKMVYAKNDERRLCYLLPFLDELTDFFASGNPGVAPQRDRATDVINYINEHLTDELSLSNIARRFFISQNHLNRIFKESTGTTLWDYITVKRLVMARDKINAGQKPTDACISSGFKDYATFFRAYKKHFEASPKTHKQKNIRITR